MNLNQFVKQLSGKDAAEWSRDLQARKDAAAAAFKARAEAARLTRDAAAA